MELMVVITRKTASKVAPYGKIFSANYIFGAIVKILCKTILRSFQKKLKLCTTIVHL
jgi:hypothetical protein